MEFSQGDVIKIVGYKNQTFVIISKNAFIKATGVFHVSPLIPKIPDGPLHVTVFGKNGNGGVVLCEQIKLIDPTVRSCNRIDSLTYGDVMNVSDAVQGIFEYD